MHPGRGPGGRGLGSVLAGASKPPVLFAQPGLSPAPQMPNCIEGCEKQIIFRRSPTVQNIKAKNM